MTYDLSNAALRYKQFENLDANKNTQMRIIQTLRSPKEYELSLPIYELSQPAELNRMDWYTQLRRSAWGTDEAAKTVSEIIENVYQNGDDAVVQYMRQWTDPSFQPNDIKVVSNQFEEALNTLKKPLRNAIEKTIEHVRIYQEHIKPQPPTPFIAGGAELGLRLTPLSSVGLLVPGGKAAYPSTLIMLAVPAIVAGVPANSISVVTPPPTRSGHQTTTEISPWVLAACALLGINRVYRIGGAQGVAALAIGTNHVDPVDMIVGPGNVYTQLAKQQLSGRVGIDGFYGPSEILTLADKTANPAWVAADLIAQAEHDPGRCFLVTWERDVIDQINSQIQQQLVSRQRRQAIEASFKTGSAAVLVPNETIAAAMANQLAPEHVNLAVKNPEIWLSRIQHGGCFFLGDAAPVASGDYVAGPSHCLPTGVTARFNSGISAYTFLKRSGTVRYPQGMPQSVIDQAVILAEAEGLDGHAASMRVRKDPRGA